MDKKTKIILGVVTAIVIIIALFIPYTEKEPEPIKLTEFSCSETSENQENDTKLNKISCSQYQELTKSEEENLILIARPTCSVCVKFTPILEEIIEEYGITVNYFDTDVLSKDEVMEFYNSSTLFQSDDFGTPTLITVSDGYIRRYKIGYMDKKATISWLKKAKVINDQK